MESLLHNVQNASGAALTFTVNEYRSSFLGVVRSERDIDHLPSSSVKVKNECSYTFTPPICLHAVDRDKFTIVPLPQRSFRCRQALGYVQVPNRLHHATRIRRCYWANMKWPLTHRSALCTSLIALVILVLCGTLKQKDRNISATVLRRTIPKTDVSEHSYVLLPLEFAGPCLAQN